MTAIYKPDDLSDEFYENGRQMEVDAYNEGFEAGYRGYGAGMCPKDFSDAEVAAWLDGHSDGAAAYINERNAA